MRSPRAAVAADESRAGDQARARLRAVRTVVCLGLVAGVATAPRLWSSTRFFPLAPPFDFLPALSPPLDLVVTGAFLAGLAAALFTVRPLPLVVALAAALVLAIGDQNRWQPWFFQYVVMLAVIAWFGANQQPARALNVCRAVVAGIYFWSGVQKLNAVFLDVGLTAAVGDLIVSEQARALLRSVTPLVPWVEAAMGAGLLHPRTRRVCAVAVIAMHTAILVTLGPLGRSWNSVVWPWNLTMITLVVLLFGASSARPAQVLGLAPPRSPIHVAIAFLFWFMPALGVFGLWDSYLSAALYSQNLRHGAVKVSAEASARLPEEIRRHIEPDSLLWLQDWALAELNAPVYPEARVFEKITRSLCKGAHVSDDFVLLETSKPDLVTGERTVTTLRCDELD